MCPTEFMASRNRRALYCSTRCRKRRERVTRKYGIGAAEYRALLDAQVGACPICRGSLGENPHVDHDHATGKVRALLCSGCNVGLGQFRDNPAALRAAADYVEHHA